MIVKCFATLLALLATAATWYATWDCHFFTITDTVSPQQAGNSSNLTLAHSYGLLLVQGTGVDVIESLHTVVNGTDHFVRSSAACVTYGNFHEVVNSFSNFDSYLWAGTAFGVLALVFSFPVFFLSLAPCCLGRNALNGLACSAFVLAIFTALEFLSLHSNLCTEALSCDLSIAGKVAIGATGAWIALIPLSLCAASVDDAKN